MNRAADIAADGSDMSKGSNQTEKSGEKPRAAKSTKSPAAVSTLIDALKNESPPARRAAARALGRLGPAAKAAESALIGALRDSEQQVRQTAARAPGKIREQ